MDSLPRYVNEIEDQPSAPNASYSTLLTRISDSLTGTQLGMQYSAPLEAFLESQNPPLYSSNAKKYETSEAIQHYPLSEVPGPTELTRVKQHIVKEFFACIEREDNEGITLLIDHNLVTANTTNESGCTPLLAAVQTSVIHLVKRLLELGADPNAFGTTYMLNPKSKSSAHTPLLLGTSTSSYTAGRPMTQSSQTPHVYRTPLMLAAHMGSLPIVKLLFEAPYSANDALVAPDGQIALRLAAASNHAAVVAYLPSRRGGGFLRFKTRNAKNIARIKKATTNIGKFTKCIVWDLPKFIVWTIPKHCVVLPVAKLLRVAWENRKIFRAWCKTQLMRLLNGIGSFGKELWKAVKEIPENSVALVKWLWHVVTVGIPNAVRITLKWVWFVTKSIAMGVWHIVRSIASFVHATILALVTFLRNVTLKDIWNAFALTLKAIFVNFPKALWSVLLKLEDASYQIMRSLFGFLGEIVWFFGYLLVWTVVYIPKSVWYILRSLGNSFAHAGHEVVVWINPKV